MVESQIILRIDPLMAWKGNFTLLYRFTLQTSEFVKTVLRLGISTGFIGVQTLRHQARFPK
jgi:hypothetical protein